MKWSPERQRGSRLTVYRAPIVQLTLCDHQRPGGVTHQVNHIQGRVVGPTTRDVQILCSRICWVGSY